MDKKYAKPQNAKHRLLNLGKRNLYIHDFTFELISRIILVRKEVI